MNRVFVFTAKECPYCKQLKTMLIDEKISFFDLDIEENEDDFLPIIEQSGLDLVPAVMLVNGLTGDKKYLIPERDFKHLNSCVQLIKENLK